MLANKDDQPNNQMIILRGHVEELYMEEGAPQPEQKALAAQPPAAEPNPFPDLKPKASGIIKSPDDLIKEKAPNKVQFLTEEMEAMKIKHQREVAAWRQYDERIHAWKAQVAAVVDNLKKELTLKNQLVEDLKRENQKLRNR